MLEATPERIFKAWYFLPYSFCTVVNNAWCKNIIEGSFFAICFFAVLNSCFTLWGKQINSSPKRLCNRCFIFCTFKPLCSSPLYPTKFLYITSMYFILITFPFLIIFSRKWSVSFMKEFFSFPFSLLAFKVVCISNFCNNDILQQPSWRLSWKPVLFEDVDTLPVQVEVRSVEILQSPQ